MSVGVVVVVVVVVVGAAASLWELLGAGAITVARPDAEAKSGPIMASSVLAVTASGEVASWCGCGAFKVAADEKGMAVAVVNSD